MAVARLGLVSGNHALLGLCIAFISASVGMCPVPLLTCNLFPVLPALACHHRLCWNLPLVIILASRGQDGLLLKVSCASCGTEASAVSSCLGDELAAPSKEWRSTSAGSEGSGKSVEP